jgi:hypothetical protein
MLIKITEIRDAKLGTFDAKELVGTRIDNGEEWSKKFFANNLALSNELAEFGVGESINVKMKQNGKYWDLTGFETASPAMIEKVKGQGAYNAGDKPTHTVGNAAGGAGGGFKGGKGTWTPDPNKDRGVSLRYAIDSVMATEEVKGMDRLTFTQKVNEFMKVYVDLMTGKDPFKDAGDEKGNDDPLAPPEGDDSIPF